MIDLVPVRRALISLSDKAGLDSLAEGLKRHGIEVVSTGERISPAGRFGRKRKNRPRCGA